jgi:hypothetical protein
MTEPTWQRDLLRRVTAAADPEPAAAPPPQPAAPQPPPEPPPQQLPVPPQYQQPYQEPYQQQYYAQPQYPAQYGPPQQYQQPPAQLQQPAPVQPAEPGGGVLRRLGQLVSEAGFIAGASGRMQRDVENIGWIRKPIAITRTVGVVSPVREAGTSVVTMLLADTLAAQRPDNVLAIDTDPQRNELSHHLEPTIGSASGSALRLVRCAGTADSLSETLGQYAGGASRTGLAVVDCAGDLTSEISAHLALTAHALVMVIPSPQLQASYCLDQLSRLGPEAQQLLLTRGVMVVTAIDGSDTSWVQDWLRERNLLTLSLEYDAHLANAWPYRPDALQPASRRTALELAARVVERATR